MINVVVLGFDQALSSAITGVLDLFSMAGVTWQRLQAEPIDPHFSVRLASKDGEPIQCINGLSLSAHLSYEEALEADLLIVPTIGGPIERVLPNNPELLALLRQASDKRCTIAGNCTGNFLLAESGILDGLAATTHWGFEELFRGRYPQVKLNSERLMTRDGHIYCSGGGLSWFDLGLHLVEKYVGFEAAIQTAKAFVLDYRRDSQLSYSLLRIGKPHQDDLVARIQAWLDENFAENHDLEVIADQFGVSKRTLIRRFNAAIEVPPHQYIQALRIESARKHLEQNEESIDQIMVRVGYQDSSAFRRLFKQKTGLTPNEYRRRFSRTYMS